MNKLAKKWCYWVANQLKQDSDILIIIDGYERSGKSSLAYHLGMEISKHLTPSFGTNNFVWDGKLLTKMVKELPQNSVIVYDEAGEMFSRRAMSGLNVSLMYTLQVSGFKNHCLIFCCPSKNDIDVYIRNHRAQFWINTNHGWYREKKIRGLAVLRSHVYQSLWNAEPYWSKEIEIRFNKMPKDFKARYLDKKEKETSKKMLNMIGEAQGETKKDLVLIGLQWREKHKDKNITDKDLMTLYNINNSYFYRVKKELMEVA